MAHTWTPPPPPPPRIVVAASAGVRLIIPLLLLLPLFLFRANRVAQAWWIWLPTLLADLVGIMLVGLFVGGEASLREAVHAFLTGLTAVWLLAPYLRSRYRILVFLKTLPLLASLSLIAYVPTLVAAGGGWLDFRPFLAGLLALASLAATTALTLASVAVHQRFGRVRFLFWLALWTVLGWTAIAAPFAVFELLGSLPEWGEFFVAVLVVSGVVLALLVPLLLLSFFQPFYWARFADWLNLPQPNLATGIAVPPKLPNPAPLPPTAPSVETAR